MTSSGTITTSSVMPNKDTMEAMNEPSTSPNTYEIEIKGERDMVPLRPDPNLRFEMPPLRVTTTFKYQGAPVVEFVGDHLALFAPGYDAVEEMLRRANAYDELVTLLRQAADNFDGHIDEPQVFSHAELRSLAQHIRQVIS